VLVAGVVQFARPQVTAEILGSGRATTAELHSARELSTANIGMGLAGLLALVPVWAAPAGAAGGVFLLLAGLMHIAKRDKTPAEALATWTDLLVGAITVVLVAGSLAGVL
jgi:hypothetical protein